MRTARPSARQGQQPVSGNPLFSHREAILALLRTLPASCYFVIYKRKSSSRPEDRKNRTHMAYDKAQERLKEFLIAIGVPEHRIKVFDDQNVSGKTSPDDREMMTKLLKFIKQNRVALVIGIESARFFRDQYRFDSPKFVSTCGEHNVPILTDIYQGGGGSLINLSWLDFRKDVDKDVFVTACVMAGKEGAIMLSRGMSAKQECVEDNKFIGGGTHIGFYVAQNNSINVYSPHVQRIYDIQEYAIHLAKTEPEMASLPRISSELRQKGLTFAPFDPEYLGSELAAEYAFQRSMLRKSSTWVPAENGMWENRRLTRFDHFSLSKVMLATMFSNVMLLGTRLIGSGESAYWKLTAHLNECAERGIEPTCKVRDRREFVRHFPELSIYNDHNENLFFDAAKYYSRVDIAQWYAAGFSYDADEDLLEGESSVSAIPWERRKFRDNRDCILRQGRPNNSAIKHAKYGGTGFCLRHGMDDREQWAGYPNRRFPFWFKNNPQDPSFICDKMYQADRAFGICSQWGNNLQVKRMLDIEITAMMEFITTNNVSLFAHLAAQSIQYTEEFDTLQKEIEETEALILVKEEEKQNIQQNQAKERATFAKAQTMHEKNSLETRMRRRAKKIEELVDEIDDLENRRDDLRLRLELVSEQLSERPAEERDLEVQQNLKAILEMGDNADVNFQRRGVRDVMRWFGVLCGRKIDPCFESLVAVQWHTKSEPQWYVGWRLWHDDLRPFTLDEKAHIKTTWDWGYWEDIAGGLLPNRRYSEVQDMASQLGCDRRHPQAKAERKRRFKDNSYRLGDDARLKTSPFDQFMKTAHNYDVSHLRLIGHPYEATHCQIVLADGTILQEEGENDELQDIVKIPANVRAGLDELLKTDQYGNRPLPS